MIAIEPIDGQPELTVEEPQNDFKTGPIFEPGSVMNENAEEDVHRTLSNHEDVESEILTESSVRADSRAESLSPFERLRAETQAQSGEDMLGARLMSESDREALSARQTVRVENRVTDQLKDW